jgi:hypothetical protein
MLYNTKSHPGVAFCVVAAVLISLYLLDEKIHFFALGIEKSVTLFLRSTADSVERRYMSSSVGISIARVKSSKLPVAPYTPLVQANSLNRINNLSDIEALQLQISAKPTLTNSFSHRKKLLFGTRPSSGPKIQFCSRH